MNWERVLYYCLLSRYMDLKEKREKVPMSFSSAGHELVQVLVAFLMDNPRDAASIYYRSRAFAIASGVSPVEIFASALGKGNALSNGRDTNQMLFSSRGRNIILPPVGDVGGQYPKAAGWAQSIIYKGWEGAVSVAIGGDGSVATNGFWSALNISTTLRLPMIFVIEDNAWGIGVPSHLQVPEGNVAKNLSNYGNLKVLSGKGYIPEETLKVLKEGFEHARSWRGPVLIRFSVARIEGHSASDRQEYYRSREEIEGEKSKDPLIYLERMVDNYDDIDEKAKEDVDRYWKEAESRKFPEGVGKYVFFEGEFAFGDRKRRFSYKTHTKMKMAIAIRKAIEEALEEDEDVVVFGEDVGIKGGIYGITRGLQKMFGSKRVFDTSLNEVGIVGRAEGMAMAGLKPICEIQFRKYADEARQPIHNIGFLRWRTNNKFSAPVILRMPVGFIKGISDPWHSFSSEQEFLHMYGWKVAYPSNSEDAYYLLKEALNMNDPVIFLEHRQLYFSDLAEREIKHRIPFGRGRIIKYGNSATVITWGYMVYEVLDAVKGMDVEVIDLRTLMPWDRGLVFESVRKTGRVVVVHEDSLTCGFGGEIVASVVEECFESLKSKPIRIAVPDVPIPFSKKLFEEVVPNYRRIRFEIEKII